MSHHGFHLGSTPAFFDLAELPVAPDLLHQFLEATHQKTPDYQLLSTLVLQDAALCYRVLEFGRPLNTNRESFGNIVATLETLGPNAISSLGIAAALQQKHYRQKSCATTASFANLWEESLRCAHAAHEIAQLVSYERPNEAYLAGLLHNLGRTLLLQQFHNKYGEIPTRDYCDPVLDEIEKECFFVSAPELAANLTRDWHQAPFFSDALRYQEETAEAVVDTPPLVKLVNLAHKLSSSLEGGEGRAAALLFNLTPDTADSVAENARRRAAKAAAVFKIADWEQAGGDTKVCSAISRHVRSAAALHGLADQINRSDCLSPWPIMLSQLGLLFGLPRTLAFEYRPQTGTLNCVECSFQLPDVKNIFSLALEPGRSLIARSVLLDRPLTLEGWDGATPPYVIERQLQRMLSTPGIFCIPLVVDGDAMGALVAGVDQNKFRELNKQLEFVEQFARTCAQCLNNHRKEEVPRREVLEDQHSHLQKQVRSLIHEASNPLGIIRNYLHLFSMKLEDRQDLREQITVISEEIDRVSRILGQMKNIQTTVRPRSGSVNINRLIKDLTSVWRDSLLASRNITDQLLLQEDIPPFQCCADSLKQILTNLVKNAVEAMAEGGKLTIASRAPVNINGHPHVEISVADDGPGLPPAMLDKAFSLIGDSAKRGGQGLGLAIVGELVANLNGFISCSNRESGGAEFILRIPSED